MDDDKGDATATAPELTEDPAPALNGCGEQLLLCGAVPLGRVTDLDR
jgi:hypothetical protein